MSAEDWATWNINSRPKIGENNALRHDVEEFVKAGGKITTVGKGVSGDPIHCFIKPLATPAHQSKSAKARKGIKRVKK